MQGKSSRREFLRRASAGAAAVAVSAGTYARAAGANDRISIGIIGCGRGYSAHMPGVHKHGKALNAEITAVCDPWRQRRERAAAKAKEWYGRAARQFVSYKDLLAQKDIDAVMIASCDHQHTTHLEAAAKAKKDAYCEKPLAMDVKRLNAAYDAVKASNIVVQAGTQLRSYPSFTGCRELYKTGVLGKVARIEQCRNSTTPYWYSRVADVKEKDVDWREFLMHRPMRPFNPVQFSGWYGFLDFSDGPVPGLASHFVDLVHYITGAKMPKYAVAHEGIFTWKDKYGFTCPDHVQAVWEYPEGFLVSYSTNFGNGGGNCFRIQGDQGAMDLLNWTKPTISSEGAGKKSTLGKPAPINPVPRPDHWLDWLQCLRNRKAPNASIDVGYQHAITVLMAVRAARTGRRQTFDPKTREIRDA